MSCHLPRKLLLTILLIFLFRPAPTKAGIYKKMAEHLMGHIMGGWDDGKSITLGLKNKGMTAIIPFPIPIPMFSKSKGGGGQKVKYVPIPVPAGKEDWWR
ncbi:hypothetical protein JTE90_004783 [Oedothorax gibbosus]|uniref:Uncharacterized protein n=1 Tax=Oedothorax gibbosus TaxID=931172 RepID=A0AAV6VGF8_9ARAC|nr:hypothetical protein JTE90_004783 [Oedothorax gibbosus]